MRVLLASECYFVANLSKDILIANIDKVDKLEPIEGNVTFSPTFDAYYGSQIGSVFTSTTLAIEAYRLLFFDSKVILNITFLHQRTT